MTAPVLFRHFSILAAGAILAGAFFASVPITYAQTLDQQRRSELEAQLAQIEADIAAKRGTVSELQKESASLKRDISILNAKISAAQLQIKKSDLTLKKIAGDITIKQGEIVSTDARIAHSRASMASLIRQTREHDGVSIAETILSGSFSEAFKEMDNFQMLQNALQDSLLTMRGLRTDLTLKKNQLEGQETEAQKVKQVQVLAKNAVQRDKQSRDQVLRQTQGKEKEYQKLIQEQEKTAAQIRAALFELQGTSAISFGTAYQYAKEAGAILGVRPALILGILREETNLGENIGNCSYTRAMHPTRDVPVFLELMSELGLDPNQMKVSCKPSYGWGGAMGPAQFIPSTWKLYKERVGRLTGQNPPSPYNARVAVFAAAMLMADNGATDGTRAAERLAALRYFAGYANANKAAYAFYGDDVMDFADQFQANINVLEGR